MRNNPGKRNRNRNRRPGGGGGSGGGGGGGGGNRNQVFDSNGPAGRIRGSAFQVYERYMGMARDAAVSGDRILSENLMQHAEHYFRIHSAFQSDEDQRQRDRPQHYGGTQGDQPVYGGRSGGDDQPDGDAEEWQDRRQQTQPQRRDQRRDGYAPDQGRTAERRYADDAPADEMAVAMQGNDD